MKRFFSPSLQRAIPYLRAMHGEHISQDLIRQTQIVLELKGFANYFQNTTSVNISNPSFSSFPSIDDEEALLVIHSKMKDRSIQEVMTLMKEESKNLRFKLQENFKKLPVYKQESLNEELKTVIGSLKFTGIRRTCCAPLINPNKCGAEPVEPPDLSEYIPDPSGSDLLVKFAKPGSR